jgi:hypothetical protein
MGRIIGWIQHGTLLEPVLIVEGKGLQFTCQID